jgi:photosystem II stability/assembly factor-like uncharacterized protein
MKKIYALIFCLISLYQLNAQWTTNGPYGATITCDVQIGTETYIGTNSGIYKTPDNGLTWQLVSTNLPAVQVEAVYYDGNTMYAGISDVGYNNVYISNDLGVTWTLSNTGLIGTFGYGSFCSIGTKVFLSSTYGIYYSNNNGANWIEVADAFTSFHGKIYGVGTTLYALDMFGGTIRKSIDEGVSWLDDATGLGTSPTVWRMYFTASTRYAVGENVYASPLNGGDWVQLNTSPQLYLERFTFDGTSIYASVGGNSMAYLYKFDVNGNNWMDITNSIVDGYTDHLFIAGTDVFLSRNGGLYKFSDMDDLWQDTGSIGLSAQFIYSVFADGQQIISGGYQSVFNSGNNGDDWTTSPSFIPYARIFDIHKLGTNYFLSTDGDGVYKSTDNGNLWGSNTLPGYSTFRFADDGTNLYVAREGGLSKSTDNGTTWAPFSTGLPSTIIAIDLLIDGGSIFAACAAQEFADYGVYKSALGTASFTQTNTGMANLTGQALAKIGSTIYVGTEEGVYKSEDQASSWLPENTGIANRSVYDLLVIGNNLLAATDSGVFIKADGSGIWTDISYNLPTRSVNSISNNAEYILAGTNGASVWKIPLLQVGIDNLKDKYEGVSLYPNPARQFITLQSNCSGSNTCNVIIRNSMGQVVMRIPYCTRLASINIESLTNGIYLLEVLDGELSHFISRFVKE